MQFASDNTGPVHPKVMEALAKANEGYAMGYGADPIMGEVRERLRDLFDAPEAAVHLVINGTTANCLLLATMAQPWDAIFCTGMAHIEEDEGNGPEFFTGGAKLTLVDSDNAKMTPQTLARAIESQGNRGVHGSQRGPVSITQATEIGSIYTVDEIRALTETARSYRLRTHMDGARFANAAATLGVSAAEMSTHAGIDAISFGGTKNGLMGVEACILVDPELSWAFELRRKRAGHLLSKHRYLSAQMLAYLTDDLWMEMAAKANAQSAVLQSGMRDAGARIEGTPNSNLFFAHFPRRAHQRLKAAGAVYYTWGEVAEGDAEEDIRTRFVTNWATTDEQVARFLDILNG